MSDSVEEKLAKIVGRLDKLDVIACNQEKLMNRLSECENRLESIAKKAKEQREAPAPVKAKWCGEAPAPVKGERCGGVSAPVARWPFQLVKTREKEQTHLPTGQPLARRLHHRHHTTRHPRLPIRHLPLFRLLRFFSNIVIFLFFLRHRLSLSLFLSLLLSLSLSRHYHVQVPNGFERLARWMSRTAFFKWQRMKPTRYINMDVNNNDEKNLVWKGNCEALSTGDARTRTKGHYLQLRTLSGISSLNNLVSSSR